ncbi:MAG: hypothetical protein QOI61_1817 [Actinomycetota bacterium]
MTVVIAAAIVMAGATPAFAHSVAGSGATNYKTTLRRVSPSIPGVHLQVIEAGSRLELSYSGDRTIYVLGYVQEQYLRIDERGVFENLNSPATYINKTRNGVTPPGDVDPRKAPRWQKVTGGTIARWHDHRVHFMGDINPRPVRAAPGERHVIQPDWQVPITDGTTTAVAHGDLVWVPGPSAAPYLLLALALALVMLAIGRGTSPFLPVGIATAVIVVMDIAHSVAIGFANGGSTATKFAQTFAASIVSVPAWLVGAGAVWFLLRRRIDGFFAAVFTGLIVAVVGGIADVSNLSRSQVPFAVLPMSWSRPIVAVSLGLGFGVALASGLAIRRLDPKPAAQLTSPE